VIYFFSCEHRWFGVVLVVCNSLLISLMVHLMVYIEIPFHRDEILGIASLYIYNTRFALHFELTQFQAYLNGAYISRVVFLPSSNTMHSSDLIYFSDILYSKIMLLIHDLQNSLIFFLRPSASCRYIAFQRICSLKLNHVH
jgi:hypothetical protein